MSEEQTTKATEAVEPTEVDIISEIERQQLNGLIALGVAQDNLLVSLGNNKDVKKHADAAVSVAEFQLKRMQYCYAQLQAQQAREKAQAESGEPIIRIAED